MLWYDGKENIMMNMFMVRSQHNKHPANTHTHTHILLKESFFTVTFNASKWIPHLLALAITLFFNTPSPPQKKKKPTVAAVLDAHLSESDSSETSTHSLLTNDLSKPSGAAVRGFFSYLANAESRRTRGDSWSSAESDVEPDDWLLTDVPYASHALSWTPSAHSRTQISSWTAASSTNKTTS